MTACVVLSMILTPLFTLLHARLPQKAAPARAADVIEERHEVLQIGFGRFGQIVYYLLHAAGYPVAIIDLDEQIVAGFDKYGMKSYFGDGSRPELLRTAGIEPAKVLVVAINNLEQALHIVRFARAVNPHIKIVARAYDRLCTFRLYQAGADEIIRETFDAAVHSGKRTLEFLGVPHDMAKKVGQLFFRMNRRGMGKMAALYNPDIARFQNRALAEENVHQQQLLYDTVQALLHGEEDEEDRGDMPEADDDAAEAAANGQT